MSKQSRIGSYFSSIYLYTCYAFVCLQAVYTASIPEDLPINSKILRVGATDADVGISARIQYSLHGPGSQDFVIGMDTGMGIV